MGMEQQAQQVRGGRSIKEILAMSPAELQKEYAQFPDLIGEYARRISGRQMSNAASFAFLMEKLKPRRGRPAKEKIDE